MEDFRRLKSYGVFNSCLQTYGWIVYELVQQPLSGLLQRPSSIVSIISRTGSRKRRRQAVFLGFSFSAFFSNTPSWIFLAVAVLEFGKQFFTSSHSGINEAKTVSSRSPALGNSPPAASLWILNPWQDLVLIVGTPLLIFLGMAAAQRKWSADSITPFVIIWAIGHHLPGVMRAYGDRELFTRFKARFIVAPLLLVAVATLSTVRDLSGVLLVTAAWGWWHYLAQTYGFVRIYDAKASSFAPLTCWLDKAMCVAWFAAAVMLTTNGLPVFLNLFYKSGGPILPESFIEVLRTATAWGTGVVTVLFLVHTVWMWRCGRSPNPVKLLLMATTFAFYWYSLATVRNILVAYALFELFHDIQYLTIVWVFNRKRVEKHAGVGAFTRFLFRQRGMLMGLYVLLVFAYGSLKYGAAKLEESTIREALLGVFLASTLLHYYYDGFIWRLREHSTRQSLGLAADGTERVTPRMVSGLLSHGLYWSLFIIPVALLIVTQRESVPFSDSERWRAISSAVPENVQVHFNLGVGLEEQDKLDEAISEYRKALVIKPEYAKAHYNLGFALTRQGKLDAGIAHYRMAVKHRPGYVQAHSNLGAALSAQGRLNQATHHFRQALLIEPDFVQVHNHLGLALARQNKLTEAASHFRQSLRLNPKDSFAQQNLARVQEIIDKNRRQMSR